MSHSRPLPELMVAPNGARRSKADHPNLPITLREVVDTAVACRAAGADGLHLHVRDTSGAHSLDTGLYREALAAISDVAPDLFVQATSEAAGRYSTEEQRAMIRDLRPRSVSVALREMIRTPEDQAEAARLYAWAADDEVVIQHIAYNPHELDWLIRCFDDGTIPGQNHQIQLVLGSYGSTEPPAPGLLNAYAGRIKAASDRHHLDWMVCAFGPSETSCLAEAHREGAKLRVGFENSFWNADGTFARDNAERVAEVKAAITSMGTGPQTLSPADR